MNYKHTQSKNLKKTVRWMLQEKFSLLIGHLFWHSQGATQITLYLPIAVCIVPFVAKQSVVRVGKVYKSWAFAASYLSVISCFFI